ncbi:hypothetical protein [Variovorax sp. GB1P17]|uniref:hypothetical protein n=1 Tax=Variovorax sp. GB1P17 TaxID=3443740 RepID=UPI003F4921E0
MSATFREGDARHRKQRSVSREPVEITGGNLGRGAARMDRDARSVQRKSVGFGCHPRGHGSAMIGVDGMGRQVVAEDDTAIEKRGSAAPAAHAACLGQAFFLIESASVFTSVSICDFSTM